MTLAERYKNKSLSFLVNIIEHQSDYTENAIQTAFAEIKFQAIRRELVIAEARSQLSQAIEVYLYQFNVINDSLTLPESYYFNEEEVKLIFRAVFSSWNTKQEDMNPDSWQYILAAGLG